MSDEEIVLKKEGQTVEERKLELRPPSCASIIFCLDGIIKYRGDEESRTLA